MHFVCVCEQNLQGMSYVIILCASQFFRPAWLDVTKTSNTHSHTYTHADSNTHAHNHTHTLANIHDQAQTHTDRHVDTSTHTAYTHAHCAHIYTVHTHSRSVFSEHISAVVSQLEICTD